MPMHWSPFEKAAYVGTISIAFDGDTDPVIGLIKTRDLLVKQWVASAKTSNLNCRHEVSPRGLVLTFPVDRR